MVRMVAFLYDVLQTVYRLHDTFLKIKRMPSGWSSWCATEQQRKQYIREYERKEGIRMDRTKIKKNPGLRSLAKTHFLFFCYLFVILSLTRNDTVTYIMYRTTS